MNKKGFIGDVIGFWVTVVGVAFILLFASFLFNQSLEKNKAQTLEGLNQYQLEVSLQEYLKTPISSVWENYAEDFQVDDQATFGDLIMEMERVEQGQDCFPATVGGSAFDPAVCYVNIKAPSFIFASREVLKPLKEWKIIVYDWKEEQMKTLLSYNGFMNEISLGKVCFQEIDLTKERKLRLMAGC